MSNVQRLRDAARVLENYADDNADGPGVEEDMAVALLLRAIAEEHNEGVDGGYAVTFALALARVILGDGDE